MPAKKDPLKAKEARQKKIAIVGGVLLLGLLAFQVPRTMKMLHGQDAATTSASTAPAATTAGSTPLAPPSLDGSSAASAAAGTGSSGAGRGVETSADGVVDASSPLPASSGQLVSFNRFKTKDPFAQQVEDCTNVDCGSTNVAGGATSGGSAPRPASGTSATPTSGGGSSGAIAPVGAARSVATASISVNGSVSKVTVGQTFPATDPVFVLVSLTTTQAKISISGGSLEGGAPAVGLRLGKTLTLQNTADGARYVLKLVATS